MWKGSRVFVRAETIRVHTHVRIREKGNRGGGGGEKGKKGDQGETG